MNKKIMIWSACFAAAVAGCGILFFAARLPWKGSMRLPAPRPDVIATSSAPGEMVLMRNKTAGYAMVIPRTWYLEKSEGSGVGVYPDYDAAGKIPPDCKIEISTLSNQSRASLADWLAAYFHADPTADVREISRATMTVSGAPAVVWTGLLDGISSTLAYVATGTKVYEIAPSWISGSPHGAADPGCEHALGIIMKTFSL